MEWWESNDYDVVDEAKYGSFGNGNVRVGTMGNNVSASRMRNAKGQMGTNFSFTRNNDGKGVFLSDKTAKNAGVVAGGLAAGAALKYGVQKYRANKAKQAQAAQAQAQGQQTASENCSACKEDWIFDPGAQHIMEGYLSEFGDADTYGPEPQPNEWDDPQE